jgi:cysteinyl-tRNA synthetase
VKVHERLADNFDTPSAVEELSKLVVKTNEYLQKDKTLIKVPLVRQVSRYVFKMFKIFGVYEEDVVPSVGDV